MFTASLESGSCEWADPAQWQEALIAGRPFLDVRSEVEFREGALPGAVNLPLLTTEERHQVGLCYKTQGQAAAIALGHQLVQGVVREQRLGIWLDFLRRHPDAILYCFRGGLRSEITQRWITEAGGRVSRIEGGYRRVRQFILEQLEKFSGGLHFYGVAGHTGSGKTRLLQAHPSRSVDLEALARHRGSAFGSGWGDQPSQADFENQVSVEFLRKASRGVRAVWIEDEARMIGRVTLPVVLFEGLRSAPLYVIEEPRPMRAQLILEEYVLAQVQQRCQDREAEVAHQELMEKLRGSLLALKKKLGNQRLLEILVLFDSAAAQSRSGRGWESHLAWITRLLEDYYDPYYQHHLEKNLDRVRMRAPRREIEAFLMSIPAS